MSVRTLTTFGLVDVRGVGPAIAITLGLLALGVLFRSEVVAAVTVWEVSTAYNHCFLVIPIVLYLIWDRRETLRGATANPSPLAILAGIPLAIAWLIAERLGFMEGRQLVAMTFVELLFFVVLGPRLWWRLSGPLLYLYFLVPFGAFLTPNLQDITTEFVAHGLPLLRIPAYITGYTIEIPEGTFLIAEACAGLRFLIAAFAFGCLYALVMYRTPLRRAVFIGASIVVPIIANGFRALGIVALGHYLGSAEAVEADHVLYGWVFFSIVILILIALGLPFRQDQTSPSPPRAVLIPQQKHMPGALLGAVLVVVLAGMGPAVAAEFDRAAVTQVIGELPSLDPGPGCVTRPAPLTAGLDAPGRMIVQRFECGVRTLTVTVEVLSPRSTAGRLVAEQRRLAPGLTAEDAEVRPLAVPNSQPGAWRLIGGTTSADMAAISLWIDGKPAQFGMTARARQAWRSVFGANSSAVLVVVTADGDGIPLGTVGRQHAATAIADFVQSQSALADVITRLSRATD